MPVKAELGRARHCRKLMQPVRSSSALIASDREGRLFARCVVVQRRPADAMANWQRLFNWAKRAMTQVLTPSTVGLGPMHRRLTSVSHAARKAGVTWLGNFKSVAAAGRLAIKTMAQARHKCMTTSVSLAMPTANHSA